MHPSCSYSANYPATWWYETEVAIFFSISQRLNGLIKVVLLKLIKTRIILRSPTHLYLDRRPHGCRWVQEIVSLLGHLSLPNIFLAWTSR